MSLAQQHKLESLPDGRLAHLDDWCEEIAMELAQADSLELSSDHWEVIHAMRDYYHAFNISPVKKLLMRNLASRTNSDRFSVEYLSTLFPNGVLMQGSKIAGVPVPYLDVDLERKIYQAKAAAPVKHFIHSFEFEGERFEVTPTGNLLDPQRWNARVATFMAAREGIELGEGHWEVINFLREFYFTYGISPMVKILMRYMTEDIGTERASKEHLYSLFPKGPSRQGSRIAGLPEPQGCIDPDE